MSVQKPKWEGYFLVRDKDGNPKVDDLATLPEQIKQVLTPSDWAYLEAKNANS